MKRTRKGIYCLEIGEWFGSLKRRESVEPILALLEQSPLRVPYIHRDVATDADLRYYIRKWTQGRHQEYPILFLAFHGSPGFIDLAKENGHSLSVSTKDLFRLLEGKCGKRVIHLGACSALRIHGHEINRYLRISGAVAISGYSTDVKWIPPAAFELLYLSELQENAFTRAGLLAVKRRMQNMVPQLGRTLGFKMRIKR